ncbi:MAG: cytochrome c oxidase subunit 3 [Mariprofundaceae bacterium]
MSEIVHETRHWHTSANPLMVGFGTCLFMPIAFMLQFVYGLDAAALAFLAIGCALMVLGGLGWAGETIGIIDDEGWSPQAMFMFIGTEVMTIGGVVAAYWVARIGAPVWPPAGTPEHINAPIIPTVLLMISSLTIAKARSNESAGNASGYVMMTFVTAAIWIAFAANVISEWNGLAAQGFTAGVNAYATALFGFTGIHVFHIVLGLLVMLTPLQAAMKGRLSPSYVRSTTMYVHFVNILGLMALFQVYLWA